MKSRIVFLALVMTLVLSFGVLAYNEAPMLKEKVDAGLLPAVEDRLPEEPLVIEPWREIGEYGGTWRRVAFGVPDIRLDENLTAESLVRWTTDGADVVPNVAKAWDISDDAKVFTFYLYPGMRWSDGEPFTAADFDFWWNDVILNKEITPVPPTWVTQAGKLPEFKVIDDYTIQFAFSEPYGTFLRLLAHQSHIMTRYPAHYLKQFHADYLSSDELEAKTKDAGFEYWYQLFANKEDPLANSDLPVIWAWKTARRSPGEHIAERNAYYWKVDTAGNQLPYLDYMRHDIVEEQQILTLKAATGEVDMQIRHMNLEDLPLYKTNEERYGYKTLLWDSGLASGYLYYFNFFHEDPILRDLFRNDDFRRALSLAIDRYEVNDLVFMGQGKERQGGVVTQSPFHVEGTETNFAQYDPELANEMLDHIGLTKRDSEGYRVLPNGERLDIVMDIVGERGFPEVSELLAGYWKDVGVRMTVNTLERSFLVTRANAGEWIASVWQNNRGLTPEVEPVFLLPGGGGLGQVNHWRQWWDSDGARGEEPPAGPICEIFELYDQVLTTADTDEQVELMQQIVKLNMDHIWYTGVVGDLPQVVIVKDNFMNVPENGVFDWVQKTPGPEAPEQFFIKQ